MGEASDDIKLTAGSVIEITRLPGYTLETKGKDTMTKSRIFPCFSFDWVRNLTTKNCVWLVAVMGEVVSKVESELLCRAYIHMYLGDDAFDKDAREKFGVSLLSLF